VIITTVGETKRRLVTRLKDAASDCRRSRPLDRVPAMATPRLPNTRAVSTGKNGDLKITSKQKKVISSEPS
jgi:hypothetical protein